MVTSYYEIFPELSTRHYLQNTKRHFNNIIFAELLTSIDTLHLLFPCKTRHAFIISTDSLDFIELLVSHIGGEHVLDLNRDLGVGLHNAAVLELNLDFRNKLIEITY